MPVTRRPGVADTNTSRGRGQQGNAADTAAQTSAQTNGTAIAANAVRFERAQRLAELVLGGQEHATHVVAMSHPSFAPSGTQKVHNVRLSASGMATRDDGSLGKQPVLPPTSLPDSGGKIQRHLHQQPAWAVREARNWPFLYPGRYATAQDFFDFKVHQRSPTIRAALNEIARAAGVEPRANDVVLLPPGALRRLDPKTLSPIAAFIVVMMRPYDGNQTLDGIFQRAVTYLVSNIGFGGTVVAGATCERLAPGGAAFFEACREAIPERRGLQQTLHRAHLPIEPVDPDTPLTREEAAAIRAFDPRILDEMVKQAPIPEALPMLEDAKAVIESGTFEDCHAVAVQHVLATNLTMFKAFEELGLDPKNTELVGIPYSTNYVVEHAFRERGYTIDTPDVVDPNDITAAYERAVEAALDRAVQRARTDGKPILLLDDGGKATTVAARKYPHLKHLFRGVEQTTRGITEIANAEKSPATRIEFPVVDVARSALKKHEMPKIGAQIASEVEKLLGAVGLEQVRGRDVTVIGYGLIGRGTAHALKALGANVTVWDNDEAKRREATRELGTDPPPNREAALRNKSLIVGATGHRSITRDDIPLLSHECVLASASSRDVEIDLSVNRDRDVETIPLLAAGRGDKRFITRVWRFRDRDVVVLRNGFPLNFSGDYETGTNEDIQQTRALMLLAAAQAMKSSATALEPLSVDTQRAFAKRAGIDPP